jgi:nickel/cobalt transporter (NiCoT) family protein
VHATTQPVSRRRRIQAALTPAEWRRALGLAGAVAALHVIGFGLLLILVIPHDLHVGGSGFGVGLGLTAYTLGLRHAFDADHIGAIDNTTRRLLADGKRPMSVGFWFSLGHSTVVLGLAVLFSLGVRGLAGAVEQGDSTLHQATGVIGPGISGAFLILIGVLNALLLADVLGVVRTMRRGGFDERELEARLDTRGLANRVYGRAARAIRRPWQMYPLGFLFGLGFDTATEVALLFLAAGAAGAGLPWYAIVCLPVLFAAGMSLLDTIDGAFMSFAYGWALSRPVRKVFYNLTITGLSVAVALLVGTVELLSVLADRLRLSGGVWDVVNRLDLNQLGLLIVGLFVLTWAVALAVWRLGHIEERWSAHLDRP